jgi:FAD/FMN-containing dehydrogenase
MEGLPKDGTGYDLDGMMVGSEGTLGVITAMLRLVPQAHQHAVALIATGSIEAALAVLSALCNRT